MRVVLLHNSVGPEAGPDEVDTLVQAREVGAALEELGHSSETVACDLDLAALSERLAADPPDLAFNLVEGLGGHERLIYLVPALLDALGVAYTGSPTEAIFVTTNKLAAKERLTAAGLPTPRVLGAWPNGRCRPHASSIEHGTRAIVKSVWDHGSRGLSDDGVVRVTNGEISAARLAAAAPRLGGACFAEQFIEGREFNLALLAGPDGPVLLPPAEIQFLRFPAGKPRIVNFDAKWNPRAFEYDHTPRRTGFPPEDRALLAELGRLARECWRLFGLAGWARVDFRVDGSGQPFILEINANPCLALDGGFASMLEEARIPFREGIARILDDALAGREPHASTTDRPA
jgi:D-alanine-D-alanine ligase